MDLENYYFINLMKKVFYKFNINAYLVGGAVRDIILGITPKDFDFAAEVDGDTHFYLSTQIANELKCKMEYNTHYHTAKFMFKDADVDFVMAREEYYPYEAAKPEVKPSSILNDLMRRDYTVNTISVFMKDFKMYDPLNGLKDLNEKKLRIMHDKSFEDDPTRILRGIKYASRLNFVFEKHTEDILKKAINDKMLQKLNNEVFMAEVENILKEKNFKTYIELFKRYDILDCMSGSKLDIYDNLNYESYKNLKPNEKLLVLLFNNSSENIDSIIKKMCLKKEFKRYADIIKYIYNTLNKSDEELYTEIYKIYSRINLIVLDSAFGKDTRVKKFIKYYDKINIDTNKIKGFDTNIRKEAVSSAKAKMLSRL